MTKASDNEFPSVLLDEQASAPTTPSTGFWRVYAKSDGLYIVDDAGTETGPLSTGGGGGGSGLTTLLDEEELASDTTTVEFSSISGDHAELRIEVVGRSTRANTQDNARVRFGNTTIDSGSNYHSAASDSNGGLAEENGTSSGNVNRFATPGASETGNLFGLHTIVIPQYANTSIFKPFRASGGFHGATGNDRLAHTAGHWASTSAIDIIHLFVANGDWASGSVFRLYGVG